MNNCTNQMFAFLIVVHIHDEYINLSTSVGLTANIHVKLISQNAYIHNIKIP